MLSILDENNIVNEDMFGVRITKDEYHAGNAINVNDIVKDVQAISDMTTLMSSSVADVENNSDIVKVTLEQSSERTSKNTFEATVGIIAAVNDVGEFIKKGGTCPVCGKHIDYMPANGYCSLECAGKDLLRKVSCTLSGEYKVETPEIIERIRNVLNYFNLVLNTISKLPDILASIAKLPHEYKMYATAKINLIFLLLKKIVNLLLIKKNELLIKLLRRVKFGTIDDKLQSLFATLNAIIKAVQAAKVALEEGLAAAYKTIQKASGPFYIGPQEYGFFWTLKSNMSMCPYYKKDPRTYPSSLLGRPFWGGGAMNMAFDMSLCQFKTDMGAKSALLNVDMTKINKAIRKIFRPITTPEYLMDPKLFDIRLALSDLNAPAIEKLIKMLLMTMVIGGDFIPTYDNLKLTNVWFVIAILTTWGPWTRAVFGDFIFHGAL